jgi:hypothetical protein
MAAPASRRHTLLLFRIRCPVRTAACMVGRMAAHIIGSWRRGPRLMDRRSHQPLRKLWDLLGRLYLARAPLGLVVRDRELDAAHRGVTARDILTDGHAAAVLRARWITGDLTGYDHPLHWKRIVILESYIDDQQLSRVPPVLLYDR